jgi:hypothetical protein
MRTDLGWKMQIEGDRYEDLDIGEIIIQEILARSNDPLH